MAKKKLNKSTYLLENAKCPHCSKEQKTGMLPVPKSWMDMSQKAWTIVCQECKREFVILRTVYHETMKTKAQQEAEAKAIIKPPTPEQVKSLG